MKLNDLRNLLLTGYNDIDFVVNSKQSGVFSNVHNSKLSFQAWCGDRTKEYDNVDSLMIDEFFDGKSLLYLSNLVEINIT